MPRVVSATWSKEGDAARDALFRSQWAHLPENATAEALGQCAAPLKVKAVRVIDHLERFVREGLDDLDRAAPALATLGATLASAGVRSADYDDMIAGLLLRAERAADPGFPSKKVFAFDDAARQSWASVLGAFVEMLEAGAPGKRADKTPVKTRAERKRAAKKTRWTGGLYKQFAVAVGLKTPKSASSSGSSFTDGVEPVAFNLDQSDSIASPGPGAGPKAASTGLHKRASTSIRNGPVPVLEYKKRGEVERAFLKSRSVETFFGLCFTLGVLSASALAFVHPERSVPLLGAAFERAAPALLGVVASAFVLNPAAAARCGFFACVAVAARLIVGHCAGVEPALWVHWGVAPGAVVALAVVRATGVRSS